MDYNLDLTSEQKKAMASVLIDIINADGVIHEGEKKYLKLLQTILVISDKEIEAALDLSVLDSLSIIKEMDHFQKQSFAYMMQEMIKADGEVDPRETDVYVLVCTAADIAVKGIDPNKN